MKRGCGAVAAAVRDEKRENLRVVEIENKRKYVVRKLSFVFRVCMGLVGSSWSESDPVIIYQFWRL